MTALASFRFLSVERELVAPGDWDRSDWPRLWRYNLHYFDDLAADDAADRASWHRALIERWIAENPPGRGTGWEPYPVSLRIVNWIKWCLVVNVGGDDAQTRLSPAALHSLAVQARWLRKRLEIHLLGNHMWANAKALVFAGAFFDGPEAHSWRDKGLALLRRELREQILPDGGHFERSPMYHATLLEDLLDLVQLDGRYPGLFAESEVADWRAMSRRMLRWLRVMSHPDGEISFFNDAAFGIAPNLAALSAYAAGVGVPIDTSPLAEIEALPDSGYVRLERNPAVVIADVGPIGPDYLPGHAHADTLSFELSLHGRRVLVNSGTSTYDVGAERLHQRGTAAHNTVLVDGCDSSEVWSAFRVARRARPLDVAWGRDGEELWIRGGHDGYARLPGRVLHRREWRLSAHGLRVIDRLDGRAASAQARFHLHPDAVSQALGIEPVDYTEQPSSWHPRFSTSEPNVVLVVDFAGRSEVTSSFRWPVAGEQDSIARPASEVTSSIAQPASEVANYSASAS